MADDVDDLRFTPLTSEKTYEYYQVIIGKISYVNDSINIEQRNNNLVNRASVEINRVGNKIINFLDDYHSYLDLSFDDVVQSFVELVDTLYRNLNVNGFSDKSLDNIFYKSSKLMNLISDFELLARSRKNALAVLELKKNIESAINVSNIKEDIDQARQDGKDAIETLEKTADSGLILNYQNFQSDEKFTADVFRWVGFIAIVCAIVYTLMIMVCPNYRYDYDLIGAKKYTLEVYTRNYHEYQALVNIPINQQNRAELYKNAQSALNDYKGFLDLSEREQPNIWSNISRFSLNFLILLFAWYCFKESIRHRYLSDKARHTWIELASLDFFIARMTDDDKTEVRKKLIDKYFGNNFQYMNQNTELPAEVAKIFADKLLDVAADTAKDRLKSKDSD